MRKIGYHSLGIKNYDLSFVRPLERSGYPRFHIYPETRKEELIFKIHLDRKKPTYEGMPAHSGEYKGKIVEEETERIKKILETN